MESIAEFINEGLAEVRWLSYAGNCEVERKKVEDLLTEIEKIHQIEKIKAQIEVLEPLFYHNPIYPTIDILIILQQQLKELQDANN